MHDVGGVGSVPAQSDVSATLEEGSAGDASLAPGTGSPPPPPLLPETEPEEGGPEVAHRSLARRSLPWLIVIVLAALVAVLLRVFVFQTFFVPSGSMEPTLLPGDRMLVLKFDLGTIQRGEIIVFKRPPGDLQDSNNEDLVKRVIGLPGQTIYSSHGKIYVNGKPIAQPWLPKGQAPGPPVPRLTVPKNEYFVMGDNRPISYDSRYWQPHFVPRSDVIGQVVLVIWRNGHPYFRAF